MIDNDLKSTVSRESILNRKPLDWTIWQAFPLCLLFLIGSLFDSLYIVYLMTLVFFPHLLYLHVPKPSKLLYFLFSVGLWLNNISFHGNRKRISEMHFNVRIRVDGYILPRINTRHSYSLLVHFVGRCIFVVRIIWYQRRASSILYIFHNSDPLAREIR